MYSEANIQAGISFIRQHVPCKEYNIASFNIILLGQYTNDFTPIRTCSQLIYFFFLDVLKINIFSTEVYGCSLYIR